MHDGSANGKFNRGIYCYVWQVLGFVTLLGLLVGSFPSESYAQQKKKPARHKGSPDLLALDVVYLNGGTTLYGVIHDASDTYLTLVVDREWFKVSYPDMFKQHAEAELKTAQAAHQELVGRIDEWIAERSEDVNLTVFLEDEKAAADKRMGEDDLTEKRFTFVQVPHSDIRRHVLQTAERRQIGLVSWYEKLSDVESRTAADLKKELEKKKATIRGTTVDFSDDVPPQPQSDRDWAMRKNIVEFVLSESLVFQGTGDSFFRKGEQPGLSALLSQLIGQGGMGGIQQIGEELGLPEFTRNKPREQAGAKDWWKKQAATADKEGFRCFSITRLDQDLSSAEVKVAVSFIGKDENDEWQLIAAFDGSANADEQSDEDVDALMDDPQVKQIVEMAETMGLGAGAQVKKALRHGVATQAAMQDGMNKFAEFTDRYSQRLDAPKIPSRPK